MALTLPKLPYAYQTLGSYIDAHTMEIHRTKHHNAYTTNLNATLAPVGVEGKFIEEILRDPDMNNAALRNNAGRYYNHNLSWGVMSSGGDGKPTGELAKTIDEAFSNFESFREAFSKTTATRFGSGWAWLCTHKGGRVEICSTPNQDNPLMPGTGYNRQPVLGLDVWEHAYYLHHQNRCPDYIEAFFNVVNWEEVAALYATGR